MNLCPNISRAVWSAALVILILSAATAVSAQTSAFTYQGRLTDNNGAANGSYSFQFRLYDAETGGNQIGTTEVAPATVTNGIFTVKLDFGPVAFASAANRWLEIQVGTTTLTPRQEITPAPVAIQAGNAGTADTLSANCVQCVSSAQIQSVGGGQVSGAVAQASNATQLGGVAANQYVVTTDSRLSNSRNPSGTAAGDLTGTYPNPTVSTVGGQSAVAIGSAVTTVTNANSGNVNSALVRRDATGSFSATTITAALNGNATSATNASQLGGVAAASYVQTTDTRLSNARTPNGTAGGDLSGSYPNPVINAGAVTAAKIASGNVVKTVNGLTDAVTIAGSSAITVVPSGNTITLNTASPLLRKDSFQFTASVAATYILTHSIGNNDISVSVYKQNGTAWDQVVPGPSTYLYQLESDGTIHMTLFTTGLYRFVVIG